MGWVYTGYNINEKFFATGCFKDVDGEATEGLSTLRQRQVDELSLQKH